MPPSPLVVAAAAHARDLHREDVRKGTGESYFDGHLAPVAALVATHGGDDVQIAAAYLHDAVEDHGGTRRLADLRRRFGAEVADIVADLSDSFVDTEAGETKQSWRPRKEGYLARLASAPARSLEVAAADKCANVEGLVDDYRRMGERLWERFSTGVGADQHWYYAAVAGVLAERLPAHPLVERIGQATATLGELLARAGTRR